MGTSLTSQQIEELLAGSPFIAFLNLRLISLDGDKKEIVMHAPMRAEFERGPGSKQWHGGPIAALIDTAGDFALAALLGRTLPTINFRVDYLRPAIDTSLTATACVRRNGRTVGVADVDVTDDSGNVVAIGRATYATTGTAR
jgi:uncharacterized protein (TIGR00369 family)